MVERKWDGYCRASEDIDPCPDCGADVATDICRAWKRGLPPEERNYLRIILVHRDTGEVV